MGMPAFSFEQQEALLRIVQKWKKCWGRNIKIV